MKYLIFFILIILGLSCQNEIKDPYRAMEDYYAQLKISTDIVNFDISDSTNLKALFSESGEGDNEDKVSIIPPPNIEPMLEKKLLIDGKEIPVEINSIANRRGAVAYCINNQPKIYFPNKEDKRISPYALVFFRFHEYAHHVLGHTSCTRGMKLTSKEEIMADCYASDILEDEFGIDGAFIIHHMAGTLNGINTSASGHHPSSIIRAQLLYSMQKCDQRTLNQ